MPMIEQLRVIHQEAEQAKHFEFGKRRKSGINRQVGELN